MLDCAPSLATSPRLICLQHGPHCLSGVVPRSRLQDLAIASRYPEGQEALFEVGLLRRSAPRSIVVLMLAGLTACPTQGPYQSSRPEAPKAWSMPAAEAAMAAPADQDWWRHGHAAGRAGTTGSRARLGARRGGAGTCQPPAATSTPSCPSSTSTTAIRVRVPGAVRRDIEAFANLRFSSRDDLVSLSSVATLALESGPADGSLRPSALRPCDCRSRQPLAGRGGDHRAGLRSVQNLAPGVSLMEAGDAEEAENLMSILGRRS